MMTEKPKIQYIGQFYVPGSEAQVLAPKKKKKKAKTKLPIAKQEQVKAIYIDPVALIGITVAVVMLAVMVVGGSYQATSLFLRPGTKGAANDTAGMGSVLSLAWGEDSLSWYVTGWASGGSTSGGTSAEGQLNEKGAHYTYLVLG